MRTEFSTKVRAAAFERSKGACEQCRAKLFVGKFAFDHVLPDALGGEPALDNCAVLCSACHGEKTAKGDVPAIAKADRIRAKHFDLKKAGRQMPGSRSSNLRKRMDGSVVPR